jgi:hypothetical protein
VYSIVASFYRQRRSGASSSKVYTGFKKFMSFSYAKNSRVAVGIALAGDPPHGSGRAELPHPALALGRDVDVAEEEE